MQQIKITAEDFDLEKFVETSIEFLKTMVDPQFDPTVAIDIHDTEKEVPEVDNTVRRDLIKEMKEFGAVLFFPFSENNMGEPIKCADGNEYILPKDCADDCGHPDLDCSKCPEQHERDEVNEDFCMGDTDCVGYLVSLREVIITIDSAMYYSGSCTFPSSSDLQEDCYIFDEPMYEFAKSFIK
jgi:hypothetical protein